MLDNLQKTLDSIRIVFDAEGKPVRVVRVVPSTDRLVKTSPAVNDPAAASAFNARTAGNVPTDLGQGRRSTAPGSPATAAQVSNAAGPAATLTLDGQAVRVVVVDTGAVPMLADEDPAARAIHAKRASHMALVDTFKTSLGNPIRIDSKRIF